MKLRKEKYSIFKNIFEINIRLKSKGLLKLQT